MIQKMCDFFVTIIVAGILYSGCLVPVEAQNPTCPTRPFGDNTASCANTMFVQKAIAPLPSGLANPTATIGLTVVNGVLTTAMRSDAAPPLNKNLSGADTAVFPTLNTNVYLDFTNTRSDIGGSGAQLQFGTVAGNPYAMFGSYLNDGTSPGSGSLVWAIKNGTAAPLASVLWLTTAGALVSTDNPGTHGFGGTSNFQAYNLTGFQNFIGYTNTAPNRNGSAISGYFVAENDDVSGLGTAAWGIYAEGRAGNFQFTVGAEIDVQNTSGIAPRTIDPNSIFGSGSNPIAVAIWSQADGSKTPITTKDSSAWAVIVNSLGTGTPKFQKGLVIADTALVAVGGHTEFISVPRQYEIAWYAAAGTVGRLTSNSASTVPLWNGNGIAISASSPVALNATTGDISCATCTTSAASLTANQLVIGSGSQGMQSLGSLGATTTVLHGNAAGAPSFGAVVTADITDANITYAKIQNVAGLSLFGRSANSSGVGADITGTANQIPIVNNAGTSLVFVTVSGDLTNATGVFTLASVITAGGPIGGATSIPVITYDAKGRLTTVTTQTPTVTSVNGVAYPSSYTSGGIPYASGTGTIASSGLLAANAIVIGGGAGTTPSTTTTGTGVLTALGVNVGSAGAFVTFNGALGTPSSGTVTNLTGTASININGTVGATSQNTGQFTSLAGTSLVISTTTSNFTMTKSASGQTNNIYSTTAGINRWALQFSDSTAESGSNLGSDWRLLNYNDAGGLIGTAIVVFRNTGNMEMAGSIRTVATTAATSKTTGALQSAGGLGVAGATFTDTLSVITMAADTAQTDATVCRVAATGLLYTGTGAVGICLGTSGAQFKVPVDRLRGGLAEIMQIDFGNYRYKPGYGDGGQRTLYGPTAQNVEAVLPALAGHDINGTTINYDAGGLFFVGMRAIQELKADNDNLRAEFEQIKRRIAR